MTGRQVAPAAPVSKPNLTGVSNGNLPSSALATVSGGQGLRQGRGVAFRHEIARLTVAEEVSKLRRIALHRRVLETLLAMKRVLFSLRRVLHVGGDVLLELAREGAPPLPLSLPDPPSVPS